MQLLKDFLKNELNIIDVDNKLSSFNAYEELLLEWNKKINLVSRKNDSIETHLLNSLFFIKEYPLKGFEKLIDIGTGGGFPGIPLKIIYPDISITLLDSINKKVTVVSDIIQKLGFINAEAICGRAEDISKLDKYNKKFDIVISKAVSTLDNLYKWGDEFLNDNGKFICIKGGDVSEELYGLTRSCPGIKIQVIDFNLPEKYNIEDKKIVIIN